MNLNASAPVQLVRRAINDGFRDRVGGPERAAIEERIFRTPGPRWFAQGDPIWRVHSDPSMFVGGVRALLVQALHPLAMAGVTQHSGYRDDPWGRLQRTSLYLSATTFGPVDEAEETLRRIRRIHNRINGVDAAHGAYDANDPHLLGWVHCALAESFLTTYQWYGGRPLTPQECDTYVAQLGVVNERLGVSGLPRTEAELHARLEGFRPELEAGPDAAETIMFLLDGPDMAPHARAVYRMLVAGAVASLPSWARRLIGQSESRWPRTTFARRVPQRLTTALTSTMRWAIDHPANQPDTLHLGQR